MYAYALSLSVTSTLSVERSYDARVIITNLRTQPALSGWVFFFLRFTIETINDDTYIHKTLSQLAGVACQEVLEIHL